VTLPGAGEFAKRDFKREDLPGAVEPRQFQRLPVNVPLAGLLITHQPGAVQVAHVFGHQHRQVLADQFCRRVAKDLLSCLIDEHHRAAAVNCDDRV
jgi:hypothetical protein